MHIRNMTAVFAALLFCLRGSMQRDLCISKASTENLFALLSIFPAGETVQMIVYSHIQHWKTSHVFISAQIRCPCERAFRHFDLFSLYTKISLNKIPLIRHSIQPWRSQEYWWCLELS